VRDGGRRPLTIEHEFLVEGECGGWRLDRFLRKRIPRLSRTRVQRVIRGECWIDGRPCKPSSVVTPGQRVTFRRPAPAEPDAPRELPLLHADDAFYAFEKPAGIAMHPTAKWHFSTITAVLREKFPEEALQITHRLDLETSGVLLIARTRDAAVALKRAFAKRRVHKKYVALVHGALEGEGVIDAPLALAGGLVRVKMAVRADGLASRTRWRAAARAGDYTLVECWPETGGSTRFARTSIISAFRSSATSSIPTSACSPTTRITAGRRSRIGSSTRGRRCTRPSCAFRTRRRATRWRSRAPCRRICAG